MKLKLPILLAAIAGVTLPAAAIAGDDRPPAGAAGNNYWAGVDWDDDDDDRRRLGAMPLPNESALKRAGMVRVSEVERDDGIIEVEGYDRAGRELDIRMDARGERVLSVRRDD